ncbi:ParB/RepB/Spo0J family partition protein [Sphingomonas sp. MG17]|uniref:ParB/RepB/Spo0J family partition protein n=1 Tax=Sphingomonas tagetis TaxID=2949092 RepID=A0A9X2KK10_9SPHN|nr:ParB/RepB/Spo0J family partition protein [Sphingomonas tagetis]MCP3729295.1 ParB/RepB/Spo0J family partition protein [Sphingomonas tagetis]
MTVRTFVAAELAVSPYNVRKNKRAITSIDGLEASIKRVGLILPLAVHPLRGSKKHGVFDGGRRFRAIQNLIARGELPADWPIDASVRTISSEAELLEISSAAGLLHVDLLPWEVMEGLRRASKRGATIEEIADVTGQTELWVKQHLRLANLAEPIFTAYVEGEISQDQAKAFAATEDHKLQLAAWEAFRHRPSFERTSDHIRRLLKVGDHDEEKLLRFVGERAFRDAGGAFELDLFADAAEHRGRVDRPGLLRELAEARIESVRATLRRRAARDDLRFAAEYPRARHGGVDRDLELSPDHEPLLGDEAERAQFLDDELLELADRRRRIDDPVEQAAIDLEAESHAAELQQLQDSRPVLLPAGDIYATLVIEESGAVETRWWWASHAAKRAAEKPPEPARPVSLGEIAKPARDLGGSAVGANIGSQIQQQADAAAREEYAFSAQGVQIVRAIRREVMRAAMIEDGATGIAHDFLIFTLLRAELGNHHNRTLGVRTLHRAEDSPPMAMIPAVRAAVEATPAHGFWTAMLGVFRDHAAIQLADEADAFDAFRGERDEWKECAAAIVAATALTKTANLDGYRLPIHDRLAQLLGIADDEAFRGYWAPDETFVELLPRATRVELATPHVDEATRRNLGTMKAAETIAPVARALTRVCWVHPALRFEAASVSADAELEGALA